MGNVDLRPTRLAPRREAHHVPIQSAGKPPSHRKRRRKGRFLQGLVITMGAMALTVAAIRASDTWIPPSDELVAGTAASAKEARCPSEMAYVSDPGGGFCIDRYEASPSARCPHSAPKNQFETNDNLSQTACLPSSEKGGSPWVNLPLSQAMELCARVGKHLPSNAEWYRAALGTPDDYDPKSETNDCVLGRVGASVGEGTGGHSRCVSSSGAYDMVGNVWEWVDGSVSDGAYEGRELPDDGFVVEADQNGVPTKTAASSSPVFHGDYLYLRRDGVMGMIRGGFWNLVEKAGVATVNATVPTSFIGSAVGFRCAR